MTERFYTIHAPVRARFALLADLHGRSYSSILEHLERREPEFICFAGDLIYGEAPKGGGMMLEQADTALPFLRECAAIAPLFLSLGNHEWMLCEEELALLRESGAVLLDNSFVTWRGLVLGGLTSATVTAYRTLRRGSRVRYPVWPERRRSRKPPPEQGWLEMYCRQAGYKILLSHHPEYYPQYLRERAIDLILSGHAHGGQICLFGHGLFAPGQGFWPKYTSGVHEGRLVISRGLANTAWPIPRLFNPREIVYITLEPPSA